MLRENVSLVQTKVALWKLMEPLPVHTSQALFAFHYFLNEQESRRGCSFPASNQEFYLKAAGANDYII